MANPWTRATPLVWPYGPNGGSGDNFSGLPNNQAKTLGIVQPSTLSQPLGDLILPPWKITLASSPTVAGGLITRYLLFAEDNTTPVWPGGISPTATGDQSAALATFLAYDPAAATLGGAMLDQLTIQSGVQVYQTRWFTISRGLIGNSASFATILIYNQSGYAFATYTAGPPANQAAPYVTDVYA